MSTVHPIISPVNGGSEAEAQTQTEINSDAIVQSVYYNHKSGECHAVVVGSDGFNRVAIDFIQFQNVARRLARFVTSSGPTHFNFNIFAQKEMAR